MLESLDKLDKEIFLFFNSLHADWLDPIMWAITESGTWIPFYVLIIAFLVYKFRWNTIFILMAIGLTITLADQFASGFCKPFFERLRPSHSPELEGLVHLIQDKNGNYYKGGSFGFISSHSANTFGLASFLFCLFRKRVAYISLMFLWAAIVSYSRIYVGVHYPGDLMVGALTGILWGFLSFKLLMFLWNKFAPQKSLYYQK
ncbi:phosphatase PAP2 family protein [Rapidithrix thailandica]|uniref:Phosphatase PAP2 family protein n=1 Tax=Rapidithrix thailandica TaxID=413964 RepID=A0AAW9S7J8_9BACT